LLQLILNGSGMTHLNLTAEDLAFVQAIEKELRTRPLGADPKLQAILWWVIHRGSMEQLREVLAAGADPNFLYNDGNTSLGLVIRWRSEKDKAEDFFRELLRAGADPTRPAEGKTLMFAAGKNAPWAIEPLLESIPRGKLSQDDLNRALLAVVSNPSLTRRLLAAGASANHRGTVNYALPSPVSALIAATFLAKHEVVELLLGAGADANLKDGEGHTAFDYALVEPKARRKVLPLLESAGAVSGKPFPRDQRYRGFAAAAKKPAFKQAVAWVRELTGKKPSPLEDADDRIPGSQGFLLDGKAREFVEKHHAELRAQGVYMFYSRDLLAESGEVVALLPTNDVYRAIAALETNGSGGTENLIAWLRELEKDQPFSITGIGPDFIEGKFTTPIKDAMALARRINEICPDDSLSPAEIEGQIDCLRQTSRLYLWWD